MATLASDAGRLRARLLLRKFAPDRYARVVSGRPAPVSLRDHLREVDPGPHRNLWHTRAIEDACQMVLDGDCHRLAIHLPPRTFKSRTVVQGFGSCWVRNFPDETVFLGMAGNDVLREQSAWARDMVRASGVVLRADSTSKSHWRTLRKGGLIARTVDGGLLGVGGHCVIIDDPFSTLREAQSNLRQRVVWDWATREIWQRAETRPDGRPPVLVLMLQRLDHNDLAGKLYQSLARGEDPFGEEPWTVLELKGRARPRRVPYPDSCIVLVDPRALGDPLCSGSPLADGIQAKIDERAKSDADLHERIDQQEPPAESGGGVFKRSFYRVFGEGVATPSTSDTRRECIRRVEWLASLGKIPPVSRWVRSYDLAAGGDDAVASILSAGLEHGHDLKMMIAEATEEWPPAASVEALVLDRARSDGTQVEVALPKEIAIGRAFVESLKLKLENMGRTVHLISEAGAKLPKARAYASTCAPRCVSCGAVVVTEAESRTMAPESFCSCDKRTGLEVGGVGLLYAEWNDRFLTVHHGFTGEDGGDDHLVDAARIGHAVAIIEASLPGIF